MRRRDFMTVLAGAAAYPTVAGAQQKAMPVIGYFSSRSAEAETPFRTAFLHGLQQAGFVVGRNVAIEYRFAEGHLDRLPALATELIGLPPGAGRFFFCRPASVGVLAFEHNNRDEPIISLWNYVAHPQE